MGYGLIDIAAKSRQQAMQGLSDAAKLDEQREATNRKLKAERKQQTISSVGMGAAGGAMIGASYGSVAGVPGAAVGAVVGAGIGYLSSLF